MDSQVPQTQSDRALEGLCSAYWYPLYAFARMKGHEIEDAKDLVQGFFCELIEKRRFKEAKKERGRFRTFLLTCFVNFQCNEWRKQMAKKRGFGMVESLDALMDNAEDRYQGEPRDESDPSLIYDRSFAKELVARSMNRLKKEFSEAGASNRYEILANYLPGRKASISQAEAGKALSISQNAVSQAVFKMKGRLRAIMLEEISLICVSPEDLELEIKFIISHGSS